MLVKKVFMTVSISGILYKFKHVTIQLFLIIKKCETDVGLVFGNEPPHVVQLCGFYTYWIHTYLLYNYYI